MFGKEEVKPLFKIGMVPWNGKVNVTLIGVAYDLSQTTTKTVPVFTNPLTGDNQTTLWYANNSPMPLLEALARN